MNTAVANARFERRVTAPDADVPVLRERVAALAELRAEAEVEFDAAIAAGHAMYLLVLRDREVQAASGRHDAALRDLERARNAARRSCARI